jgi:hypothetical protein
LVDAGQPLTTFTVPAPTPLVNLPSTSQSIVTSATNSHVTRPNFLLQILAPAIVSSPRKHQIESSVDPAPTMRAAP